MPDCPVYDAQARRGTVPEKDEQMNNMHGEEGPLADEDIERVKDSVESSEQEVEQDIDLLRREAEENHDRLLRLAAEFENYKKRMDRERDTILKYAGENILRELLNTVDNLDRAIEQGTADTDDAQKKLDAMLEGVELTRKGLLATLERFDVKPLQSLGGEFDPNVHEAMTMEASSEVPANHVLHEYVKGYQFKDRLLRPAKVVVSAGEHK
jgi:molecular chaperone GrpE